MLERRIENESKILTIIKPEDPVLLGKLQRKLEEYQNRLESYRKEFEENPSNIDNNGKYFDSLYKFAILGTLLNEGQVLEDKILVDLNYRHKGIDVEDFDNALKVIKAYVEGGEVFGGSGLK